MPILKVKRRSRVWKPRRWYPSYNTPFYNREIEREEVTKNTPVRTLIAQLRRLRLKPEHTTEFSHRREVFKFYIKTLYDQIRNHRPVKRLTLSLLSATAAYYEKKRRHVWRDAFKYLNHALPMYRYSEQPGYFTSQFRRDARAFVRTKPWGNLSNYTYLNWRHNISGLFNKQLKIVVKCNLFKQRPWHILPSSPWPFFTALVASATLVSLVLGLNTALWEPFSYSLPFLIFCMYAWANDVSHESRVENQHTPVVKRGLKLGFAGFIVSEIMFFLGFFIAQINLSIEPHVFIWSEWPPYGIQPVSPLGLALVTTAVLLSSGLTMTWCQTAFQARQGRDATWALAITIGLSVVFLIIQSLEYNVFATFNINDSVYGSCFYMITGLHGFHVIVGTLILFRIFRRLRAQEFRKVGESIGLTTGAWYWHFVDVVWLFVMTLLYITNSPW